MAMNSVNTNVGAMIALQSLNSTNTALSAAQKQISTGYRVADATDDGAAYAVAQRVRASVGALTSANQQLGNVQGLLSVTVTSLNQVSNTLNNMNQLLVKLSDGNTQGSQRSQYQGQFKSLLVQLQNYIKEGAYNGKTLIGNIGGTAGFGVTKVVQDEVGTQYTITTANGSALFTSLNFNSSSLGTLTSLVGGSTISATSFQTFMTGAFSRKMDTVALDLNYYGNAQNYVTNQISYNSNKMDALNSGLGSLVDADLAKESAQLQALQIRQQLGTQALSMANQAPSTLLSLFR